MLVVCPKSLKHELLRILLELTNSSLLHVSLVSQVHKLDIHRWNGIVPGVTGQKVYKQVSLPLLSYVHNFVILVLVKLSQWPVDDVIDQM